MKTCQLSWLVMEFVQEGVSEKVRESVPCLTTKRLLEWLVAVKRMNGLKIYFYIRVDCVSLEKFYYV